ncbi:hypothetical protein ATO4_09127 [Aurantimonas sp. 22II-16-19i]|nr:hypothetical protein ATO4_09127 [Aurantimonas sp. 22II-16-19i]
MPSRDLGASGLAFWNAVQSDYQVDDPGGRELLLLASEAIDRAEGLRAMIEADGAVLRTKAGLKDHPALKHELANRAFVTRAIARLGLNVEAVRPVGRPGLGGWKG